MLRPYRQGGSAYFFPSLEWIELIASSADEPDRVRQCRVTAAVVGRLTVFGGDFSIAFTGCEEKIGLHGMLLGVQIEVAPAKRVKRGMHPALDDATALHDKNLLGPANRGKPVRD